MKEDFGSSIEYLKAALANEPENENARYHLSLAYLMTGRKDDAMKELQRILLLNPMHAKARIDLAVLLLSESHPQEALEHLNVVLKEAENDKAYFYKAIALKTLGKQKESQTLLKKISQMTDSPYAQKAKDNLK
jgi:tetratricopeptide (TPR) repeat protein